VLDTADGEKVIVWYVPPKPGKPLVLYFHGNGGSLRYRAYRFRALAEDGTGLVALSYRGYGGSTGSPSEAGLIADAEAAYAFAAARTAATAHRRVRRVARQRRRGCACGDAPDRRPSCSRRPSPPAGRHRRRGLLVLPVRLLMKDPFHSDERIGKVTAPLLVLHGVRDGVVPIAQGERLFSLANEPKRFLSFAEGAHSDLDRYGALEAVRLFLGQIPP
jgi:fermentation-respiration switch protein FrsA (DUF1100 family)